MNKSVCHIFQVEVLAACPEIAFVVPVALQVTVDCCHQSVTTNVELAVLVKQGLFDVFLNNIRPLLTVNIRVLNDLLNL
jgi:hypothetical protein